jgi:hypothetical protein
MGAGTIPVVISPPRATPRATPRTTLRHQCGCLDAHSPLRYVGFSVRAKA